MGAVDLGKVRAERIIRRLAAINRERPVVDRALAELALHEHLKRLGLDPLPVRWVEDAELGWSAARSAAESGKVPPKVERLIGIWLPFVEATEAGLWIFWVLEREIIAVPRPALRIVDDRLHCADGPAVAWPNGKRYYFWRGVQVPEKVIVRPLDLTPQEITGERNVEVRRVMLERYGAERYLFDAGAKLLHQDRYGKLYVQEFPDDEPLVMVQVRNSTPEPDGSFKDYMLRVPPRIRTAKGAVARTFNMHPRDYRPELET